MADIDGSPVCSIESDFNMVPSISANIKLLRIVFPFLPFTSDRNMLLKLSTTDADVNVFNDMLVKFVFKSLTLQNLVGLTTTGLANLLVNVNLATVHIINCPDINIDDLRNIHPAITFKKDH